MHLSLLGKDEPFAFRWWSGHNEAYDACFHYQISDPPDGCAGGDIHIAVGTRPAYGGNRRRVIVFRKSITVLVEFVGADDWSESGNVIYLMKEPGGHGNIRRVEDIPPELAQFVAAPFDTWVSGPRSRRGLGIRVCEQDHEVMVRIALIRERHRGVQKPVTPLRPVQPPSTVEPPATRLVEAQLEVVRRLTAFSDERKYLGEHLYEFIGRCVGQGIRDKQSAYEALGTPAASLCLLLGYFAFARQGSERAGYNEVCLELVRPFVGREPAALWDEYPNWESLYEDFLAGCMEQGIGTNERFNRGLLRDIYGLAAQHRDQGSIHVLADQIRTTRRVQDVYEKLRSCHGIGPKIAAFICRDTIFLAGIENELPIPERRYMQPVDIWIGRVAEFLNPDLTFGKDGPLEIGAFLADTCLQTGVSGAAFNQGAWYFGSQIARSAWRLTEMLSEMQGGHPGTPAKGRLVVISCGAHKVWDQNPDRGPAPAREAYTGPFFTANRRYAERFSPDHWMILSSRFGFLRPGTPIVNYNARFDDPATKPIGADQLRVCAIQTGVTEYKDVQVLAGRAYVEKVQEALRGFPVRVLAPYAHCEGIGDMMGLASRAVEAAKPLDPAGEPVNEEVGNTGSGQEDQHSDGGGRRDRRSSTSNPEFIRRVFHLHEDEGVTQVEAIERAANEFGIELPMSYLRYPGTHIYRWRMQGYGRGAG